MANSSPQGAYGSSDDVTVLVRFRPIADIRRSLVSKRMLRAILHYLVFAILATLCIAGSLSVFRDVSDTVQAIVAGASALVSALLTNRLLPLRNRRLNGS